MREQALTKRELAEALGVSVSTVERRRRAGMPCVVYGKRQPRFYVSQCLPWLDAHFSTNGPVERDPVVMLPSSPQPIGPSEAATPPGPDTERT